MNSTAIYIFELGINESFNNILGFNILKDSVRGHKDLEQRNSELLKKEKEFFETLDLISKEKEQVLNDKPFL